MNYKKAFLLLLAPTVLWGAVSPYIQTRSQSVDAARELCGWTHFVNLFDQERVYGVTALTLEYTQSFNPDAITDSMFSDLLQCTNSGDFLGISGSQYPNRNANDLLADYFGLSPDFKSVITFKPTIRNEILDLNFYIGLDEWLCGLFFRIHAPIVHSSWDLNFCEQIVHKGTINYAPGYFNDSATGVSIGVMNQSFTDYVSKQLVPNLGSDVIFESLKYSRWSTKRQSLTRVSDVEAAFGWNFIQRDDYHFGLELRATAPAGNRPNQHFLFSPLIGNGHHWGLGFGLTGHWEIWRDNGGNNTLGLYADANIGTLFKTNQVRVFDLKNKPLSRYMLAELLGTPAVNLFGNPSSGVTNASSVAPTSQFQGVFRPVANLTAMEVSSSIPWQADIVLLLDYTHYNWSIDAGYDFWGISCEKLKPTCCISPLSDSSNWALKGDAFVYGFVADNAISLPSGISQNEAIALSATESTATVTEGTNTPFGTPFNATQERNPNIDNPQFALVATADDSDQLMVAPDLPADAISTPVNQQRTSVNPVLLSSSLVDVDGARIDGLAHKVFIHVNYTGCDRCGWTPYIGVGGKAEFARHLDNDCCATTCDGCIDTNVSEWGVWIKGGAAF